MSATSLHRTQRAGLLKIGDVFVPGDGELPSFSATRCAEHADRLLSHLDQSERRAVRLLLTLFRFLPSFALRGFVRLIEAHRAWPEPLAALARRLDIGIKGLVMTLYYSDVGEGASVHKQIGWNPTILEHPPTEPSPARTVASGVRAATLTAHPPREGAPPSPQEAVERARSGLQSLRRLSVGERSAYLARLRRAILKRREAIVDRIQADTAKSRSDALISEIFGVLDNLAWLEKRARRALRDRKVPTPIALLGKQSQVWYEPLGVVLVIAPWNYPFYQAVVPIACAFVAGNAVVFKPSEWTPLEGLVEDLLAEARFAPHWVQVVYGDGRAGAALIDQTPDKVFFTGSTRTGRRILSQAAEQLIPVELELGGKDAMIVFEDVHIERAVAGAAWGALTTTGQSCTSVERLYVQESIYEPFKNALVREVARLKQAVDSDGEADLGAMTTEFQVAIVARHVADAKAKGAEFLTGAEWDGSSKLVPPMVIDRVSDEMLLAREETFGPLLCLQPFQTEREAVRRANASEFGLTASVWTRDLARARRVARALEVGGVSINNVMATEANPALPFGGIKHSGFGRYKGEHGLHAFCNVKSILIDKDSAHIEPNWYPYTRRKYRLFSDLTTGLFEGGVRAFGRFVWSGLRLERYSKRAHRSGRQG